MLDIFRRTQQAIKKSRDSWFGRVVSLLERPGVGEETWQELEELLISADVGAATTSRLLEGVKERVRREKVFTGAQIRSILMEEMAKLLYLEDTNPTQPTSHPLVILVVGVNGSGKTTSIAKLAYDYQRQGQSVLLVAADTFRAAAIDQLRVWGERLGTPVIAHQPGADPGAVVYDALEAAHHRHAQVVIIDTAGRLHTKYNLMEELKKVRRVIARVDATAPHQVLLVMDATTGQNGLLQARYFTEAVGVNGIFLAKLDGTAKGGIVLAIVAEMKLPILYIGTGETLEDMLPFQSRAFVEALCSP